MKRTGIVESFRKTSIGSDHKGFSLIEVLIAMIILVIAAVPIYRSFVLTARINSTTQIKGQAKNVAENIIEGVRPYTAEQINAFFLAENPADFRIVNGFEPGVSTYRYDKDASTDSTDVYYVTGIKQNETADHVSLYDARIEIEKKESNSEIQINTMANFVSGKDYMAVVNSKYDNRWYNNIIDYLRRDETARQQLVQAVNQSEYYSDPVKFDEVSLRKFVEKNTTRTIQIRINYVSLEDGTELDGATTGKMVRVQTNVKYQLLIANKSGDIQIGDSSIAEIQTDSFNTNEVDKYPRNIFLRYSPNYHSGYSNETVKRGSNFYPRDIIEINNPGGVETTVVLVKVMTDDDPLTLQSYENDYKVQLIIYDNNNVPGGTHIKIRSNINQNIASATGASIVQLDERNIFASHYMYPYTSMTRPQVESLTPKKEKIATYLYNVNVEVFANNTDTAVSPAAYMGEGRTANPIVTLSTNE